jgi:hypothetical protein
MNIVFGLLGIIASVLMIKYREAIANMMGEASWMQKVGGVYNVVVIVAVFIFIWSLATMTGTTEFLFRPLLFFIPGARPSGTQDDFILD